MESRERVEVLREVSEVGGERGKLLGRPAMGAPDDGRPSRDGAKADVVGSFHGRTPIEKSKASRQSFGVHAGSFIWRNNMRARM